MKVVTVNYKEDTYSGVVRIDIVSDDFMTAMGSVFRIRMSSTYVAKY
jgi:hypothetical protein